MFQDRTQFLEAAEALRGFLFDGLDSTGQRTARRAITSIDPYNKGFGQVHSATPGREPILAVQDLPIAHRIDKSACLQIAVDSFAG